MTVYIDLQVCSKAENVDLDFLFHKQGGDIRLAIILKQGYN